MLYIQAFTLIGFFSLIKNSHLLRQVYINLNTYIIDTSDTASILLAVILVMTGRSLSLRRRSAWVLAIWLQSFLIGISLLKTAHRILFHHHTEHFVVHAFGFTHMIGEFLILFALIAFRKEFKTLAGRHTYFRAFLISLRTLVLVLFVGLSFVYFNRNAFVVEPNLTESIRLTIKGFLGISDSIKYTSDRSQLRLEFLLGSLGLLFLFTTIWQLLKPVQVIVQLAKEDEIKLRGLLQNSVDSDSLGYFALRDNKKVIWSRNSKAAITYSVTNGVIITTGDPIGDRESWPDAIREFLKLAELHAWIPCIYGCSEYAGSIWVNETGFSALEIGDEAIIDVDSFTLEGSAMKNVRQMVAKVKRAGVVTYTKRIFELSESECKNFSQLANQWRRGGDERGFSMALGRVCDKRDSDLVFTWSEKDGQPIALLQFVPWGKEGLSLDIMRRASSAEGGINEEMISATIEYAKQNSIKAISLNFATFRSIFERGSKLGAGPITRFNYRILKFISRFAQMESLYRFNAKFRPIWEPRFVIYPGARNLLRITTAILTIESFWPPKKVFKK